MLPAAAIERLYDSRVGTTPGEEGSPNEKPHKPLLLLVRKHNYQKNPLLSLLAADWKDVARS